MHEFNITINGDIDPVKLQEALDIAIEAVRGALAEAGLTFDIGGSIGEASGEAEEETEEETADVSSTDARTVDEVD